MSSSFSIEHLLILNTHAEKLKASLYSLNAELNKASENALNSKDVESMCKAVQEGKTIDQEKFPHLPKDSLKMYGALLRQQFSVLCHFHDFQTKSLDALRDALNESKNFDLSWNYVFVMPVIRLFTNYVRLNIFVNSIDGCEKIPIVYGYVYQMTQKKENEKATALVNSLAERKNFKKLVAEMQQIQDRFYSVFKSNISILSRLLQAGITYPWKELNLNDNPNPLDKKGIFMKPEYIIMQNLQLFCDCYLFFCLLCPKVLFDNQQFTDVFTAILGHVSQISMYADYKVPVKSIIKKLNESKTYKGIHPELIDAIDKKTQELEPLRAFRQRKLAMIMNEYVSAGKYDQTVLLNKLTVIKAILGFSNFEIQSVMVMWDENKPQNSISSLLAAAADLITILTRAQDCIQRFLIFNFREYDAPYLDSLIHSFTIPQSNFFRLTQAILALRSINIEEYDNGAKYDLYGLEISLLREMSSFNFYSRSKGVIHLSPLFTLISSIYDRIHLYTNLKMEFLETCNLHQLWGYNKIFLGLPKAQENKYFGKTASLFVLAHFYSNDSTAIGEIPNFKSSIPGFITQLEKAIIQAVDMKARNLQSVNLQDLVLQTKVDVAEKHPATNESIPKKMLLSEIPIGKESMLSNRPHLSPIYDKLEAISQIMSDTSRIGTIQVFDQTVNIIADMRKEINNVFSNFYSEINFSQPFQAADQIGITKIIFQNIMNAAVMNYKEEYDKCYKCLSNIEFDTNSENIISIKPTIGSIAKKFLDIYRNFLDNVLPQSYFSNTSQMFVGSSNASDKTPSLLASQSAIRTVFDVLGIKGIALIDVVASESFVKVADQIADLMNTNKSLDSLNSIVDASQAPSKWLEKYAKLDSDDIKAPVYIRLFCHLGAIARFRRLLRTSVDIPPHETSFQYLSHTVRPENDVVLNPRLSKSQIIAIAKNNQFGNFVGSLLTSVSWATAEYDSSHNGFTNDAHLLSMGVESILGCVSNLNPGFDITSVLTQLLHSAFYSMPIARNQSLKNKKLKFPTLPLHLVFDHMIQNSVYLDYSILEQIIPYQTIRNIYTHVLASKN